MRNHCAIFAVWDVSKQVKKTFLKKKSGGLNKFTRAFSVYNTRKPISQGPNKFGADGSSCYFSV